jgi:hypothetical protein
MVGAVLIAVMLATPSRQTPSQQPDPEIRRTIDRMFDAMRAKDTTLLRSVFDSSARLVITFTNREGKPASRIVPIDGFIQSIGRATVKLDERIYDVEIRQSDHLATVWARYTFYAGDQLSHCGYDAFQLSHSEQGWKIFAIADTNRREGCAP